MEYKDIPGYELYYEISQEGQVRNKVTGRILSQSFCQRGYLKVNFYINKKIICKHVHQLLALTFIGLPPGKTGKSKGCYQVNHIDANKLNNSIANLEWVTVEKNIEHAKNNKLIKPPKGEDHGNAIFTEEQVVNIRERVAAGENPTHLAKKLNVDPSNIIDICSGKRWTHAGGPLTTERRSGFIYRITSPAGDRFTAFNLNQFCIKNSLDTANMHSVAAGKARQYLGWTVIKEKDGKVLTPLLPPSSKQFKFILVDEFGETFETTNLKEFCRLHPTLSYKTLTNRSFSYKEYKGWKITKIPI